MGIWECGGAGAVTIVFSGVLRGGSDILRFFQLPEGHMSFRNFVNV